MPSGGDDDLGPGEHLETKCSFQPVDANQWSVQSCDAMTLHTQRGTNSQGTRPQNSEEQKSGKTMQSKNSQGSGPKDPEKVSNSQGPGPKNRVNQPAMGPQESQDFHNEPNPVHAMPSRECQGSMKGGPSPQCSLNPAVRDEICLTQAIAEHLQELDQQAEATQEMCGNDFAFSFGNGVAGFESQPKRRKMIPTSIKA